VYSQNRVKLLEEARNGTYRTLIKNESKMDEEFDAERKKRSDLTAVVDALRNDFPHLDIQIAGLLNALESVKRRSPLK